MTSKILSHWLIALLSEENDLSDFVCTRKENDRQMKFSKLSQFFFKLSDKIFQHSLLPFVVGDFCIIRESIYFFTNICNSAVRSAMLVSQVSTNQ